jgi:hypothetical protein
VSATTLYKITNEGDLEVAATYRNSFGGAMAIWVILMAKYKPGCAAWDEKHLVPLWSMANDGRMEEFERRTMWTTYDKACIRFEDMPLYAEAMERFAEVHGPSQIGRAFSIPEQAADLRRLHAAGELRGVCWSQNSACEWPDRDEDGELPYNIDICTGHNWLPGLDASRLPPASERRSET